jgi:hypothetical protein
MKESMTRSYCLAKEISVTNEARRKFIKKISGDIGNIFD